ncbi:Gentisate 12-dioxygenase [Spathaspora sp. JA1]|nr:Gentisate 12-dioxygenase [Spathaspora sp. JA1]
MSPVESTNNTEKVNFFKSLKPENVEPLWTVMSAMVPPVPKPKAIPTVWNYKKLRPLLEESGRLVPAEESERRVLMLINPSLKAPQTTDTLYAGLQYINPGEVAPAHRHSAFALRFIIEGDGGFTAVEGKRIYMERGDVILTPRWEWHDHGKEGNGPMIWLDGLDLPMFQAIPVNFAEHYHEERYPAETVEQSNIKFPWKITQDYLDSVEGDYAIYDYTQGDKQPLSTILTAQAERLNAGKTSQWRQENASFVFHIYEGQGYTAIQEDNGEETILRWEGKDTFCVPSWKKFRHVNEGESTAYLFSFNDSTLLKNLNIYRSATN